MQSLNSRLDRPVNHRVPFTLIDPTGALWRIGQNLPAQARQRNSDPTWRVAPIRQTIYRHHRGPRSATMKVPYATKWQKETDQLRKIALKSGLTEESKWSKPCFTLQGRNVAIVIPLKEACAFSFFKGALLKDPERVLLKIGKNTQAGRWIKFASSKEVRALTPTLKSCLAEAVEIEKSGTKVARKKPSQYKVPGELQALLDATPRLKAAFAALTPGRQRSYLLYISDAKQATTRLRRAEKAAPMILSGRGYNEYQG